MGIFGVMSRLFVALTLFFMAHLLRAQGEATPQAERWGALAPLLFGDGGEWWEREASVEAQKLGMHAEMNDGRVLRYLLYPKLARGDGFHVLGRSPNAVMMTADVHDGKPREIRVVFGNRGENLWTIYGDEATKNSLSYRDVVSERRKEIDEAVREIDEDARRIGEELTQMFGAPGWAAGADDIKTRERKKWWKMGGTRVTLAHSKGILTTLTLTLDGDGPEGRASSGKAVRRKPVKSGDDVYVDGVPEVHQGDKPYCSTASLERILRYYSVDIDQYEIGAAGGSGVDRLGAGWGNVLGVARQVAQKHGLVPGSVFAGANLRKIAEVIDEGIPLMWAQYSSPQTHELFRRLSETRGELGPAGAKRKRQLGNEAKAALGESRSCHACLVVGYNLKSEEIAVSNTWQGVSQMLWIPYEVFGAVSTKADLFYIKAR